MSLREAQRRSRFWFFSFDTECASDEFSRMWRRRGPDTATSVYDPKADIETLSDEEVKNTIASLVVDVRNLCIYNLNRIDEYDEDEAQNEFEAELSRLSSQFYFRSSALVRSFLEGHTLLVPLLFEVRRKISEYFGDETLSDLRVFTDPEDNNSTPKLFALILTTLSFEDASPRLDQLDEEWWLDQSDEARRLLNIDVEYVDAAV